MRGEGVIISLKYIAYNNTNKKKKVLLNKSINKGNEIGFTKILEFLLQKQTARATYIESEQDSS